MCKSIFDVKDKREEIEEMKAYINSKRQALDALAKKHNLTEDDLILGYTIFGMVCDHLLTEDREICLVDKKDETKSKVLPFRAMVETWKTESDLERNIDDETTKTSTLD